MNTRLIFLDAGSRVLLGPLARGGIGRRPVLLSSHLFGAAAALVPLLMSPGWGAGALALGLSGVLVGGEETVERAWAADLAGGRHGRAFGALHAIKGVGDLVASGAVGLLWALKGPKVAFGSAALLMVAGAWLTTKSRAPSAS